MLLKIPKIYFWENWKLVPAQRRWIRGWAYAEDVIHQVRLYPALKLTLCICYCCYDNTREARCLSCLRNICPRQATKPCIELVLVVERARAWLCGTGWWLKTGWWKVGQNQRVVLSKSVTITTYKKFISSLIPTQTRLVKGFVSPSATHYSFRRHVLFIVTFRATRLLAGRFTLCWNVSGDMFSSLQYDLLSGYVPFSLQIWPFLYFGKVVLSIKHKIPQVAHISHH